MSEQFLSTTRLAKELGLEAKQVFATLQAHGFLKREDDQWQLAEEGLAFGGKILSSEKFGDYVAWPPALAEHEMFVDVLPEWLTATRLGQVFGLSGKIANAILFDLGLIQRDQRGWMVTEHATKLGADQRNSKQGFYVVWPSSIIENAVIKKAFDSVCAAELLATLDGRQCLNKADQKIANWLYLNQVSFAYQKSIAFTEVTAGFFIPGRSIYIDYWGIDNLSMSLSEKMERAEFFKTHGYRYIEIDDEQLKQLDEFLPKKLLQFGYQLYTV